MSPLKLKIAIQDAKGIEPQQIARAVRDALAAVGVLNVGFVVESFEKCSACNGSGRYDNRGSPPCGSCNGRGKFARKVSL